MGISSNFKSKILVGGGVIVFLILVFTLAHEASNEKIISEKIIVDLTGDILFNPILEDVNLLRIEEVNLYGEKHDLSKNDILGKGSSSVEIFIENAYLVMEKNKPELVQFSLPEPTYRPEHLLIDVKSPKENVLLQAAKKKIFIHKVQPGETLWEISRMYGIDIETLIGANQDIPNITKLKVGQELKILNSKGVIHKVTYYETLSDISRIYNVSVKEIMNFNGLKSSKLNVSDTLIIPGASPPELEFKSGYSNNFIWPLRGPISSYFGPRWGKFHYGVDIVVSKGTPVKAAKSGKVIFSGTASGYGRVVYIRHDKDTVTRYAHNDRLLVKTGDFVYQGEVIALSGNSGTSTGPHLHFEIRIKNQAQNPLNYLK